MAPTGNTTRVEQLVALVQAELPPYALAECKAGNVPNSAAIIQAHDGSLDDATAKQLCDTFGFPFTNDDVVMQDSGHGPLAGMLTEQAVVIAWELLAQGWEGYGDRALQNRTPIHQISAQQNALIYLDV